MRCRSLLFMVCCLQDGSIFLKKLSNLPMELKRLGWLKMTSYMTDAKVIACMVLAGAKSRQLCSLFLMLSSCNGVGSNNGTPLFQSITTQSGRSHPGSSWLRRQWSWPSQMRAALDAMIGCSLSIFSIQLSTFLMAATFASTSFFSCGGTGAMLLMYFVCRLKRRLSASISRPASMSTWSRSTPLSSTSLSRVRILLSRGKGLSSFLSFFFKEGLWSPILLVCYIFVVLQKVIQNIASIKPESHVFQGGCLAIGL